MSLGGYMFEGRFCQKGSLTDVQWVLLMHKTKVAAFLAASARANAGWEYDMTGSSDGNYHCLDLTGNNYVTCFKNTAQGAYFAIYTLTKYNNNTSPSSDAVYAPLYRGKMSNNNYYFGVKSNSYYCAQHSSSIPYSSVPTNPYIMPVTFNYGSGSYNSSSTYYGYSDTLFTASFNYYGFAIKGADIIIFAGSNKTTGALNVSLMSMKGLSNVNEGDSYREFAANFQKETGAIGYNEKTRYCSDNWEYGFVRDFAGNVVVPACDVTPAAIYYGNMQEYPYQCISVYLHETSNLYNNILYKGGVNIELLASNGQKNGSSSAPALLSTVAGGNYLTICMGTGVSTYTYFLAEGPYSDSISAYRAVYCGWDASNPDITQESAWTEYTES